MLSSSLRRAAWAPISSLPSISRSSGQAFAASSNGLLNATQPMHQRRYSSSKPPVPPSNGSSGIDASSQAPAKGVAASGEKRATRRRGRDHSRHHGSKSNRHAAFSNPPSVPSTQHLQPHAADVHVASFFSIYRPISVTASVPPTSSAEAFNALFSSRRSPKIEPGDVIFTLSSAVNSMENAAQQDDFQSVLNGGGSLSHVDADGNQLDAFNMADLDISIEEFTKRLRPFHPPPPPVPLDEYKNVSGVEPTDEVSKQTASYSVVLTIRESTHADGRKTYEARTAPISRTEEMNDPASFDTEAVIDMPASGINYIESPEENSTMHAISTKRRRRLKMKKHKYKKLLRRTRTLRRKLDKA